MLWFAGLLGCVWIHVHASKTMPYRILYINSYHAGFSWSDEVSLGVYKYFAGRDSFSIYEEYMDAKRNKPELAEKWTLQLLKMKYKPGFFDLVLASDNSALDFVLKYRNEPILKDLPIVFCGVSNPEDYPVEAADLYGVYESDMFVKSFDIIRQVYPSFRTIYFFCDQTNTGEVYINNARKLISGYPQYHLEVVDSLYLHSIDSLVQSLTGNAIIYYAGVSVDGRGEMLDHFEIARQIFKNAKIPVFSSYIVEVDGATGGYYTSGKDHGLYTARLVEKRLRKEPIATRIQFPPLAGIYDYNKMELFNIDPTTLPKGTKVVNKPESTWDRYKELIFWNLLFIGFLVAVIILLLWFSTIQARAKQYMEKAMAKALESDMLKGAFLANVSHELRTPLNAICGFSELAKAESKEPEIKDYIDVIYTNSEVLSGLVNDLLDISLIDANAMRIRKHPVDLELFFDDLKHQAENIIRVRNKDHLQVELKTNPLYRRVNCDAFRISQVMINFITNAVKYTESGQITLGYNHQSLMPAFLDSAIIPAASLVLYVSDTGIGIDADKQHMVFERFRMVDSKFVSQHGGVGLGLNIAKSLVELMGGVIFVTSEPGKGSTFGFYLPLE
jgi:signal transduction histidine kinase